MPAFFKTSRMLVAGAILFVAACSATYTNHGYAPSESELENVIVGVDTRESVEETIGRPSSTGVLKESAWYYISSQIKYFAYRDSEVVDRQLVAISFDSRGRVENIERFTLEDGRVVTLNRRVTTTGIKGVSFIRQILGNIGRVTLGDG